MPYPLIIKDDFFSDPDAIVKESKRIREYALDQYQYPGVRTKPLNLSNPKLFAYIAQKIFHLFHDKTPDVYTMTMAFQKINPYIKDDKWDRKNRGWVHKDYRLFGGLIYMDKNPDKDSGTGMYKSKDGYDVIPNEILSYKELLYSGKLTDDRQYYQAYDMMINQYEETLRIPNVYNRLVLIPGDQPHAMTTIGDKERNTIVFFCTDAVGVYPPEYKETLISIPNHEL